MDECELKHISPSLSQKELITFGVSAEFLKIAPKHHEIRRLPNAAKEEKTLFFH
jgi:hypothetical protein